MRLVRTWWYKRHMSLSASTISHQKDEQVDEDPSYSLFLTTVFDLPIMEESMEASKIFSSRDRGRKRPSPLPMSMPPMAELDGGEHWKVKLLVTHSHMSQTSYSPRTSILILSCRIIVHT